MVMSNALTMDEQVSFEEFAPVVSSNSTPGLNTIGIKWRLIGIGNDFAANQLQSESRSLGMAAVAESGLE